MFKSLLTLLAILTLSVSRAQLVDHASMNVSTPPSVVVSPASFPTTFTTTSGTASSAQTATYTISNYSGTGGTIAFPSWMQISLDAGSTWQGTSPVTGIGACSGCSLEARVSASASGGTYGPSNITLSVPGATSQTIQASATVTALALDSIRVQFDSTAVNQSGWTVMKGSPTYKIITATGGNANSITVSSVGTSIGNWEPLFGGGTCVIPANGTNAGTVWNYAPNVMKECWFVANSSYNASYPQLVISGLLTGHHYTLQLTSSISSSITGYTCNAEYRILGNSLLAMQTLDAQPSGTENKTASLTFPGSGDGATQLAPDGSGKISIYFNPVSGDTFGSIAGFILKQVD